MHFFCRHITQQKYQNCHFEREKGSLIFSSIKLIFTPSASDIYRFSKKAPYQRRWNSYLGKSCRQSRVHTLSAWWGCGRLSEAFQNSNFFIILFLKVRFWRNKRVSAVKEQQLGIPSWLLTFKLWGLYMAFPPRASLYPAVWLITWRMVSTWWDRQGGQAGQQSVWERDDTDCKHA